ncbi:hypothetical protein CQW23_33055 [Capsicum baccatum]|uniref:Protein TAR1 n=1 Tax=Capsicum baccatum TaxID=33114 RepID=A0A2G2V2X7_CAPBA|nr:hypothetical protein CQW23_33055 [Capsicum baccatum]
MPEACAAFHNQGDDVPREYREPGLWPPPIHAGLRPESIGGPARRRSTSNRGTSPAPIRSPPDNFKNTLTLFSKSFSSFPRASQPRRTLSASRLARVMSTPCHCSCHEAVLSTSQPRPRQCLCRDSALSMPVSEHVPCHRLRLASVNVMPAPCHRLRLASAYVMPVPCHRLRLANADVMPVPLLHACPRRCHVPVVMSSVQGSLAITPACLSLAHCLSMAHVKANVHLDMAL